MNRSENLKVPFQLFYTGAVNNNIKIQLLYLVEHMMQKLGLIDRTYSIQTILRIELF